MSARSLPSGCAGRSPFIRAGSIWISTACARWPAPRRLLPAVPGAPVFTVAGTNGKGSTVALLDAFLRRAGRRTGVYTSPHLVRYNERIRIDGVPVEDATLIDALRAHRGGAR